MRAGAMIGGLAVAAITSTALSLFHELDATNRRSNLHRSANGRRAEIPHEDHHV